MEKKRILLTGATGFLGGHLLRKLVRRGHHVLVVGRTSSNTSSLDEIRDRIDYLNREEVKFSSVFEASQLDMVVHCATDYGRAQSCVTDILDANLMLPLELLQNCVSYKVPVFINTDTCLDKRVNAYSLSKKQFLDWLELYSGQMVCINAVLSHFFGPGDDPSKFAIQMIRAMLQGQPSIQLSPGEQERDFIYIDDVVRAMEVMVDWSDGASAGLHQFEVGRGESHSIKEFLLLARRVAQCEEVELQFGALPYRPNEAMRVQADNRALKVLGWDTSYGLEEAIRLTVEAERRGLSKVR